MEAGRQIMLVAQKPPPRTMQSRRRHVRGGLRLHHPADAQAARRHREGAGRRACSAPTWTRSTARASLRRRRHVGAAEAADNRARSRRCARRDAAVRPVRQAQQEDPAGDPHLHRRHRRRRAAWPTPSPRTCRSSSSQAGRCSTCSTVDKRLEKPARAARAEVDILQVEKRIRGRVKRQMEKSQREYYLNEQVKAIQKELGDGEEGADLEAGRRSSPAKMPKEAPQGRPRPS